MCTLRIGVLALLSLVLLQCTWAYNTCDSEGIYVTKFEFDGTVDPLDVIWVDGASPNQFVFVRTSNQTIWRSADFGRTWSNEYTKFPGISSGGSSPETNLYPHGGIKIMKSGPLSPTGSAVYFAGYGGKLWFTEDHGQTYTVATPAVDDAVLDAIELLVPHPYTPSVIQVVTSSVCCYQPLSSCVPPTYCRHDLLVTTAPYDAVSWHAVDNHIALEKYDRTSINWVYGDTDTIAKNYGIGYLRWPRGQYWDSRNSGKTFPELIVVKDCRTSSSTVGNVLAKHPNAYNYFNYHEEPLMYWLHFDPKQGLTNLYFSMDFGVNANRARFPDPPDAPVTGNEIGWINGTLFGNTAKSASMFSLVRRYLSTIPDNALYNNDLYIDLDLNNTASFTWSLQAVVACSGICATSLSRADVVQQKGIPGVVMANSRPYRHLSEYISHISFNKGGSWSKVTAPVQQCSYLSDPTDCSLHFLGPVNGGYIETSAKFPGFIILNGYVGSDFDPQPTSKVGTFVSLDGGVTFSSKTDALPVELQYKRLQFKLADEGSILALIGQDPSNLLSWSYDAASVFDTCEFDTANVQAKKLFADPSNSGRHLYVLALSPTTNTKDVWYFIDFSKDFDRECVFPDDYTRFTMTSRADVALNEMPAEDNCVLGQRITYWRKKLTVICHSADRAGEINATESCTCTRSDYVCDECFAPKNGTCAIMESCMYIYYSPTASPPTECPVGATYLTNTTGYVYLAGSDCIRGSYDPTIGEKVVLTCPVPRAGEAPIGLTDIYPWLVHPGAIAGAVVGTVFGVLLLVGLGTCIGYRIKHAVEGKEARATKYAEHEDDEELDSEPRIEDDPMDDVIDSDEER